MSASNEERLARLEAIVEGFDDRLGRMEASLAELARVAHMGRGALWLALKMGAALLAGLGLAKVLIDVIAQVKGAK